MTAYKEKEKKYVTKARGLYKFEFVNRKTGEVKKLQYKTDSKKIDTGLPSLTEGVFTKKQVSKITGLSPRMVQFYTEEGLVVPEVDPGKGRGRVRRYSKNNLFDFEIIKQLSKYGISVKKIREFIGDLNKGDKEMIYAVSMASLFSCILIFSHGKDFIFQLEYFPNFKGVDINYNLPIITIGHFKKNQFDGVMIIDLGRIVNKIISV